MALATRREWMFLLPNIPFRRLPIVTNLGEGGEEVRGSEMFISGILILVASIRIVIAVSLAVGGMVSVLSARVV